MRKVRSHNTRPEVEFRKALWARGVRYRLHRETLPGKPDIALGSRRIAIFIDGDFWHGNQWRNRNLTCLEDQFQNNSNRSYWLRKIRRNMERDFAATAELLSDGWTVLRLWESRLRRDFDGCVDLAVNLIQGEAAFSPASFLPVRSCAEFFAGIGLLRLALDNQGWSVRFANDIDPRKFEMYTAHFGSDGAQFELKNIGDIHGGSLPPYALATASFPCNDLSLAGGRKGLKGRQSSAFWEFIRILKEMEARRPPLVMLENVPGFLTSRKGRDLERALTALNELGYAVDSFILDAAHFVPQSRRRLFVIGVTQELAFPDDNPGLSDLGPDQTRPEALVEFIRSHPQVTWRIRPLPAPPQRGLNLSDIIEDPTDDSPLWWSRDRASYLLEQMGPRHRAKAERMIRSPEWEYGAVFRRMRNDKSTAELRTDGMAGCLRTPRGGSARQILFRAGKGTYAVRLVSPREAARLMGAGDFTIEAGMSQALFGFGDAVCVPVIEWIARYYLNPLVSELIRGRPLLPPSNGREAVP